MDSYFTRIFSLYATWRHIKTINRIDKVFFPPLFSLIAKLVLGAHNLSRREFASLSCRLSEDERKSQVARNEKWTRKCGEQKTKVVSMSPLKSLNQKHTAASAECIKCVVVRCNLCALARAHDMYGWIGREKGGIFEFANWLGRNANRFIGNFKAISACFNVELAVACPLRFVNAAAGAASISTRATRVNVTQLYTQTHNIAQFQICCRLCWTMKMLSLR